MRTGLSAALVGVLLVALAPLPTPAQTGSAKPKAPAAAAAKVKLPFRTADGQPDLQGIWSYATMTPLQRPAEFAGKEFIEEKDVAAYEKRLREQNNKDRRDGGADADVTRAYNDLWYDSGTHIVKTRRTSLIIDPPDGKIPPYTPEGKQRLQARAADRKARGGDPADSWEDRNLGERCLTRGAPKLSGGYNNNIEIVQGPGYVGIVQEMIHETRIIPLDGRPHADPRIRNWLGDSRGHWEGDTLVVDTTNYKPGIFATNYNCCGGAAENLHIIERFRRLDSGTLDYQYTVDDPATFTRQWTVSLPMTKTDGPIYEYACHEGNYGMAGLLAGARAVEKKAAEEAAKKK